MKRVTACLLPLLLLGCRRPPPAPPAPPEPAPQARAAVEADQGPLAQITAHPWWRAAVQADDVERIVDAVQAQVKGGLVLVDRDCHVTLLTDRQKVAHFRADRKRDGKDLPDRVYFDLDDYRGRPAWGRVLQDLKARLDRAEQLAVRAAAPGQGPKAN